MDSDTLPLPERERWQPLRSGFVNIYRYDQEEFRYQNGRLLLRGNNGTGKSRVLALQLPFLLDGEVIPQRLEPDADAAKRAEWNLLMGRYADRSGYTWIEFGRQDGDTNHYLTLGCSLSAVEGQTGVKRWFFITTQRIGSSLKLVGESGQVLGKDRVRERIGGAGAIFDSAGEYRKAVNRELFKLDEFRYVSLVNLLIQLRRPQLTRRLDEDELSRALSEALPPLQAEIVADVAEAFRNLESDRESLDAFRNALNGVEKFLAQYQRYAQAAARRRADRVRATQYEYEQRMRDIRTVEADQKKSSEALQELAEKLSGLSAAEHTKSAEIETLLESPQMKDAHALDRAKRDADEKSKEAEAADAERTQAVEARRNREQDLREAADNREQAGKRLDQSKDQASRAASIAGLENDHRELNRERIETAIRKQIEKAAHLRKLNERIASAKSGLEKAASTRDQFNRLADEAREALNSAHQKHRLAATSFVDAVESWIGNLKELRVQADDAFWSALEQWCNSPEGANPFEETVRRLTEETIGASARERARLERLQEAQSRELQVLEDERRLLESGEHRPPLSPYTRGNDVRTGRPGAPFWLLCDFEDTIDPEARAGFEAALEAAGLLDAWVTPTGELLDPTNHDSVLVAGTNVRPSENLSRILKPVAHEHVPEEVVAAILAQIGAQIGAEPDAGAVWVSADGRWQNGPLHGAWTKPEPQHIGQAARELARAQRLAELEIAVADANARLEAIRTSIQEVERRENAARAESASAPADDPVRDAWSRETAASMHLDTLRTRLSEAESQVSQKQTNFNAAVEQRKRSAEDLGIRNWLEDPNGLEKAISEYRIALAELWHTMQAFAAVEAAVKGARLLFEEARTRETRQHETSERYRRAAIAAAAAYETLRESIGATVAEILERLAEARRQLESIQDERKKTGEQHRNIEIEIAQLGERLRNLSAMLQGETDRRDAAAESLRSFAATGLLHLAASGIADQDAHTWSITRTVEAAREVSSRLDKVDSGDGAWERHQKTVQSDFNELMQTLSAQGCQPSAVFRDDVFVASALFSGKDCAMEDLHHILSGEVTARHMLLDAREREILENHLVGEVSSHLHDLLNAGEEQVHEMNAELESRPMSTGMKLRFVWRTAEDAPAGLAEVRKRLMRSSSTWSSGERETLGTFLQQQIQAVRSQTDTGNWQESLAEALDYRKWHRFGVERYQDGAWKRLTRRTHGTGSGGEKAVALTLPHFAAAAAFYRTADPLAPRLILLDEAFVGIDTDMRGKCMGLIDTFDLDFIMTSEREWGCYSTLPGLAIYQLSTRPGIDAIGLTRWVWNGRRKILETTRAVSLFAANSSED